MSKLKEHASQFGFLDHVNARTLECCNNVENLGDTIDMLMNMSHRDSYELRRTADQLRRIVAKLDRKAKQIDEARNG
jgi:hypothetical protein